MGPVSIAARDERELLDIRRKSHISKAHESSTACKGNVMTIHNSLSELIGNTPLVKLNHVTDGIKATIAVA